jgi:hypothetical protein
MSSVDSPEMLSEEFVERAYVIREHHGRIPDAEYDAWLERDEEPCWQKSA